MGLPTSQNACSYRFSFGCLSWSYEYSRTEAKPVTRTRKDWPLCYWSLVQSYGKRSFRTVEGVWNIQYLCETSKSRHKMFAINVHYIAPLLVMANLAQQSRSKIFLAIENSFSGMWIVGFSHREGWLGILQAALSKLFIISHAHLAWHRTSCASRRLNQTFGASQPTSYSEETSTQLGSHSHVFIVHSANGTFPVFLSPVTINGLSRLLFSLDVTVKHWTRVCTNKLTYTTY